MRDKREFSTFVLQPQPIRLLLLIGLPGSGKSTYAAVLAQAEACCVISTDAIRARLFGDAATQGTWLQVWREVGVELRQAVCQRAIAPAAPSPAVIYDATNVVRQQRRQATALARRAGFTHITGIWLDTPLDCCLIRNQQRDRQVPETVILRMHQRLVEAPPALTDGFDALEIVAVTHSSQCRDRIEPCRP